MPYFLYCSSVWHFCRVRNAQKLELLDNQALRLISDDNDNTYETLLNNLNMTTLQTRRIQHMLIMVYKALYALTPVYIRSLLTYISGKGKNRLLLTISCLQQVGVVRAPLLSLTVSLSKTLPKSLGTSFYMIAVNAYDMVVSTTH